MVLLRSFQTCPKPRPLCSSRRRKSNWEHTTITPRSIRGHCLGTLILASLEEFYHHHPAAIIILVETLQVLTSGRTPRGLLGRAACINVCLCPSNDTMSCRSRRLILFFVTYLALASSRASLAEVALRDCHSCTWCYVR